MQPIQDSQLHSERGAGLAEYALLLSLIATVCLLAVTGLGAAIAASLGDAATMF